MEDVVFALALNTGEKFVVVDGPFCSKWDALEWKTPEQEILKMSRENFEKALQW